jgi:ATP-binding cassette subfamily B protein
MSTVESSLWALFARYLRPQRAWIGLLALLISATIGLQLLNPQVVRTFVDAAQAGAPWRTLLTYALFFFGMALLQAVVQLATTYTGERVSWRATNALRQDLAAHTLGLDLPFHHAHAPGALVERVDGDVSQLAHFFSQLLLQLLGNLLLAIGILLLLWREDWRIGLGGTGFALLTVWILLGLRDFATAAIQAQRQAEGELFGFMEERLGGLEDLRPNGAAAYTVNRLWATMRALWHKGLPSAGRRATFGSIIVVWAELGSAAALGVGAWLFLQETVTLGTVYLIYAYVRMLNHPLTTITQELQHLQAARANLLRIRALLHTTGALVDGPATLPSGPLAVDFAHVHFTYPSHNGAGQDHSPGEALHDLSFTLAPGRVLGLLGRTGSGKTTITRLLLRLYDPQAGTIHLGGQDVRTLAQAALRQRVGVVTQEIHLFHATVRENLTFFDDQVPDAALIHALTAVGLDAWLRALPDGLATILPPGGGLSAGEAQLFALARLFLQDPGLVILDEAVARLDPATEARIDEALTRLLHGRTGIIIAHRLRTVQRVDELLIIDGGRVQEGGPRAALAADPHSRFTQLLRTGFSDRTELAEVVK